MTLFGHDGKFKKPMTDLQTIETAIRDALGKVDAGDPKVRQRVYGTVWTAHERSLVSDPSLDGAERASRRDRLKTLIGGIESEFRPAPSLDAVRPERKSAARSGERIEPAFGGAGAARAAPAARSEEPALDDFSAGPRPEVRRKQPRNRPMPEEPGAVGGEADIRFSGEERVNERGRRLGSRGSMLAVLVVFLAVAAGLGWTLYNGIVLPSSERNAPTPPPNGFSMDQSGGKTAAPEPKWLTVFDPADPTRLSVSGAADAAIAKNGDEQFARLKSSSPDAEIRFDVPPGVIEKLGGGPVVFDLTMQAEGDKPTQVAVRCDFGSLAPCDRKRYEVRITRQEYLLEVDLPAGIKPRGGAIAINTDIAGTGEPVDVYSIRVRPAR